MRTAGVLLAGGASRRFGSEKAVAAFGAGIMMEGPLQALAGSCDTVAVSAAAHHAAAAIAETCGYPILPDPNDVDSGPLAGILAGLRWARAEGADYLAVAPCDAPTLRGDQIADLLILAQREDGAAVAASPRGLEPLIAIWPVDRGLRKLEDALRAGRHPSVRRVLDTLQARVLRGFDGLNVNAPGDLEGAGPAVLPANDPPHARLFAFEDDFVRTLRCIPMCVRFKLDRVAIKLSLRQWSRFTLADRQALRCAECHTPDQVETYRAGLVDLIATRAKDVAKPLAEPPPNTWRASATPSAVAILARERGLAAIPARAWRGLSDLERYALVKLTRDRHENANLGPALAEFGLRGASTDGSCADLSQADLAKA